MNNKITIVPKKKESDGSNKSITITKKQIQKGAEGVISDQLPPETFAKIYHFDGVKISHFLQQTVANCGPLSIINGLTALKSLHPELDFDPRFPRTSNGIRKLLSERADLRTDFSGAADSNQIIKSSYLLASTHIFNVLNELQKTGTIHCIGDRFNVIASKKSYTDGHKSDLLRNSDLLITCSNNHFIGYVKMSNNQFICVDSMNSPYLISNSDLLKRLPHYCTFWKIS